MERGRILINNGETNITISSRADWSISSDADWFTASPSSGKRGRKKVSLITSPNETGRDRTATVTIIADGEEHIFTVRQRADIFSRKAIISGHVTNQGVLYYNGSALTKVFFVLPCPVTNEYQDISNLNAPGCRRSECPDGINHYVSKTIKNAKETVMAQSGSHSVTETFDATVYQVTTDFSLITDIPDYDPRSEECKLFLMKEPDHIDPTWGKGNFGGFKGEFVVMCRGSVISLRDTEGEEFVSQSLQKYFYHYYYQNTQGSLSAKHSCWGLR